MSNYVAEMPIYIQHQNPKVIKIVIKKLVQLLKIEIGVSDLFLESTYFEKKIDGLVHRQPFLGEQIRKLEKNYDKEFFEENVGFEECFNPHGIDKL